MQFLILGYDGTDEFALQRRLEVRQAHIELGDTLRDSGNMLYAAAMLNDEGVMCGSMIVVEFETREEVDSWLEQEPYVTGGVWEKIDIRPCQVGPSFTK
jgi:uncharacterized protein YciI